MEADPGVVLGRATTTVKSKQDRTQSAAHGQRPGKCPHLAMDDELSKECNEETRAAEANPYGTRDSIASRRNEGP